MSGSTDQVYLSIFFFAAFCGFSRPYCTFLRPFRANPLDIKPGFFCTLHHSPLASVMLTPNCCNGQSNLCCPWLHYTIPSGIPSLFPATCLVLGFLHGTTNIQMLTTCQHLSMGHSWASFETIPCQTNWCLHHIWSWRICIKFVYTMHA